MTMPEVWAREQLPGAVIQPLRTRPWADVWRVDTSDGRWWLKVNKALTVYEPRLLAVLDRTGSSLLPDSIVHPDRPWALIRDAGVPVRERFSGADPDAIVEFWSQLMPAYGELQRITPIAELRVAGVPDLSPENLPASFDALLADGQWFTAEVNAELSAAELDRIRAAREPLLKAASELAGGLPATIQHDDLHDGNVFVGSDPGGRAGSRVIDWGDAVIAHPFSTLRVTLDVLGYVLELPTDAPLITRVRDSYLEPWLVAGESRSDLVRQSDLAIRTGGLVRAAGWARALGDARAGMELDFADAPSGWLQRLADDLS